MHSRFSSLCPQIFADDAANPEPSLFSILKHYYISNGIVAKHATSLAERYIESWVKLETEASKASNKLEQRFAPHDWQWEEHGKIYRLRDLSREDLMQVAAGCMTALEKVDEVQQDLATVTKNWHHGLIQPEVNQKSICASKDETPVLLCEANLEFVAKTMGISKLAFKNMLQTLYEERYITYPRNTSDKLPAMCREEVPEVLVTIQNLVGIERPRSYKVQDAVFEDDFQGAHHAIIPRTSPDRNKALNELGPYAEDIYKEIAKRYMKAVLQ